MKSIGEILTAARKAKGLSAAEVARITKIEPKYIEALEKDNFLKLPAATFTKGFIRNYAQVVGKSPDDMIAIFRRDYAHQAPRPKTSLITDSSSTKSWLARLGWGNLGLLFAGLAVFALYLGFQYRAVIIRPPLEISQPSAKAVLTSPVLIEGKTSADSLVMVNETIEARPDASGVFTASLNLSPGDHDLVVRSENRFGRERVVTVPITVISGQ